MSLHRFQRAVRQLGGSPTSRLARLPAVLPEPDVRPSDEIAGVCFTFLGSLEDGPNAAALSHNANTLYVGTNDGIYSYTFPGLVGPTLLESTGPVVRFALAVDPDDSVYWWEETVSDPVLKKRTAGGSVSTLYTDTADTSLQYGMVWHPSDGMLWTHHMGELWEIDPSTGSRTVHATDGDDGGNDIRPAPTNDGGLYWPVPVITPNRIRRFDVDSDTWEDSGSLTSLPFNEFLPVDPDVWYPRDGAGRKMGAALTESLEACADDLPFFVFLYVEDFSTVAYLDGADVWLHTE